jgi:hypothetical protein
VRPPGARLRRAGAAGARRAPRQGGFAGRARARVAGRRLSCAVPRPANRCGQRARRASRRLRRARGAAAVRVLRRGARARAAGAEAELSRAVAGALCGRGQRTRVAGAVVECGGPQQRSSGVAARAARGFRRGRSRCRRARAARSRTVTTAGANIWRVTQVKRSPRSAVAGCLEPGRRAGGAGRREDLCSGSACLTALRHRAAGCWSSDDIPRGCHHR